MVEIWYSKTGEPRVVPFLPEDLKLVRSLGPALPHLYFFRHGKRKGVSDKTRGRLGKDYLQLMQGRKGAVRREIAVAEISRGLCALAQELDVPVVALSPVNRELMKREDKRPRLWDLREPGSIEQDADLVIVIHREDAFRKKKNRIPDGVAEIIIAKQRNGPADTIKLAFLSEYTRFEDLSYVMA